MIHSVLKRKMVFMLVKMDANAQTDIAQSVEPMVKHILMTVTENVEKKINFALVSALKISISHKTTPGRTLIHLVSSVL